jgi:hypothetical protein
MFEQPGSFSEEVEEQGLHQPTIQKVLLQKYPDDRI